ncbi:PAS domain-containing protein [Jannaschia sp. S6380]|uniref:sensor histidine kinase n=1 Tax=Jannaschia sp. S6380 TaxID=2926408 RepID=UPI001FF29061|nr:PAS domain-containing sensor histidine kinase [Jannaschia sp. S6380]MCK0166485.1 PAS domain-containing protein [Jannaschia sp. S6380]
MKDVDFRAAFLRSPAPLLIVDGELRIVEASDVFRREVGLSTDDAILGRSLFDVVTVPFDAQGEIAALVYEAIAGQRATREPVVLPPGDDGPFSDRTWRMIAHAVDGAHRPHRRILIRMEDITDRMRAESLRETMLGEMTHRVNNLFGLLSVLARRSAADETDVQVFLEKFQGRLMALASATKQLLENERGGVLLGDLVERGLAPFAPRDAGRLRIAGPALHLRAGAAQAIAMGLHELATNATKHGALRGPDGHVEVVWERDTKAGAILQWREGGVMPASIQGARPGFGSTVLQKIVPAQVGGEMRREPTSDGLVYRLSLGHDALIAEA